MATHRCSDCGINYPPTGPFIKCPIHGTKTDRFESTPHDDDWPDKVAALQEQLDPPAAESMDDLIPLVETEVKVTPDGAYLVSSWDVYDAVRTQLDPGKLIRVGKQTFEILEYAYGARQYWVRPFETTVTDEALAALAGS